MTMNRESHYLVQAIPQSHHIRPIVQIKEKQAKIEDTLCVQKRKSDNHLIGGYKGPAKYKLDDVRCSKSYS